RLNDMGIEPFLISSSLIAVMAQRLVRVLCPACREAYQPDAAQKALLAIAADEPVTFYRAKGCSECNQQGYKGRTGIYEYIEVDETIRRLIHDRASEQQLVEYARQSWPSIRDDGRRRVLAGDTTLEEVLRVTSV
ncbi:MAG TPA: type II secretion system protein GspE, partial [Pseudomonadales bacterium]